MNIKFKIIKSPERFSLTKTYGAFMILDLESKLYKARRARKSPKIELKHIADAWRGGKPDHNSLAKGSRSLQVEFKR